MAFLKLVNVSSEIKFEQIVVFEERTVVCEHVLLDTVAAEHQHGCRCLLLLLVCQLHRVVQSEAFA